MRYSELAGKEIVDLAEGVRLGVVTSSDLVIDTESGTLAAMLIYQRSGFFSSREITLNWSGVRKVGRDLIIVDMNEAAEPIPQVVQSRGRVGAMSDAYQRAGSLGATNNRDENVAPKAIPVADGRPPRHRVSGMDMDDHGSEEQGEEPYPLLENEVPEMLLGRLARGSRRDVVPVWRRGKRSKAI